MTGPRLSAARSDLQRLCFAADRSPIRQGLNLSGRVQKPPRSLSGQQRCKRLAIINPTAMRTAAPDSARETFLNNDGGWIAFATTPLAVTATSAAVAARFSGCTKKFGLLISAFCSAFLFFVVIDGSGRDRDQTSRCPSQTGIASDQLPAGNEGSSGCERQHDS